VLLSKSTAALIEDALIDFLSLRDLGAHRLKGLPRPSSRWIRAGTCAQPWHRGGC
jgi:hypothetical protein